MTVYNRWLGFGDFERKYGSNLWVMLENSAKILTVTAPPETGTPKAARKKRNSTGKGKRGKAKEKEEEEEVPEAAKSDAVATYNNFWDDQERFLAHSISLGLDFVFLHYLTLLTPPYFPEELFVSIANIATKPTCTIDSILFYLFILLYFFY